MEELQKLWMKQMVNLPADVPALPIARFVIELLFHFHICLSLTLN